MAIRVVENDPSRTPVKVPSIPFPQRLRKKSMEENIHPIAIRSGYAKFLKEMLTKKRKLTEFETVALNEESSARVQSNLPHKLKDSRSFTLPISIGNSYSINALCDTGANINLMSYSVYRKLGLGQVKPTSITLQLVDRTISRPCGKVEDVLIKAGNLIFLADFIVLDISEDRDIPVILGWPFLAMGRTLIDMKNGELILRVEDK
ncbi:uncharacterized protein LOC111385919 [Olea europaea var. sylvestris]|uniref:uncharacterized protein LOC111385919 n=1 Tax=Olea europaea var. sylvestris TaxID=158386 RepID=UPI000C1D2B98|nr:uncharacterized protein LOC111385919 [Olea europaea var. sylvestris]